MGFRNNKEEAVYNWLTENGSEKVAIFITNYFSADIVDELYDELVAQDEIDEDEEDEEVDDEMRNAVREIVRAMREL